MRKVINVILLIVAAAMLFLAYRSIADQQHFTAEVKEHEAAVKERLIQVRLAEEAYKAQKGEYCANWDTLIAFVNEGKLPIVVKQGVLTEDQMEKGLTESKAAAIVRRGNASEIAANGLQGFRRDTSWVNLKDSLYEKEFVADSLRYIPYSGGQEFRLFALVIENKSGTPMAVMECEAEFQYYLKGDSRMWQRELNNQTDRANTQGGFNGLKIGDASLTWNNNAGNWE